MFSFPLILTVIHFLSIFFFFFLFPLNTRNSKRNRKQRGEDPSQNKERKQRVGKKTRIQERYANFQLQTNTFFFSFGSKSLLLLFPFSLILNVTHFCFRFFLSQENRNRKDSKWLREWKLRASLSALIVLWNLRVYFTCCFYLFVYLFLFTVLEGESTCVHCDIMFESSEHLRIHTFNEHKKYEYYCQCRNAFPTKAAMDQHFNELHSQ